MLASREAIAIVPAPIPQSAFARDVLRGLSAVLKTIPSKYFYDERGSRLFEQIMDLDDYYPTRCEREILQKHAPAIAAAMPDRRLRVLEAGAGDGRKTEILLRQLLKGGRSCEYVPIDICPQSIAKLTHSLDERLPNSALRIRGLVAEYFEALGRLERASPSRNLVLFLGSNIGNFDHDQSKDFLKRLRQLLRPGDLALIGFDLKKDLEILRRAYDDDRGVTREFNFNLLDRINRELGGCFERGAFRHHATYNLCAGCMESWLVSVRDQEVPIHALDRVFALRAWEGIRVERSYKYDLDQIEALALATGFGARQHFFDGQRYFVDSLWEATPLLESRL